MKLKRQAAGISGSILCAKAGISRSRLSLIERGYVAASAEELDRLGAALDSLVLAKSVIDKVAESMRWSIGGVR